MSRRPSGACQRRQQGGESPGLCQSDGCQAGALERRALEAGAGGSDLDGQTRGRCGAAPTPLPLLHPPLLCSASTTFYLISPGTPVASIRTPLMRPRQETWAASVHGASVELKGRRRTWQQERARHKHIKEASLSAEALDNGGKARQSEFTERARYLQQERRSAPGGCGYGMRTGSGGETRGGSGLLHLGMAW
ncbi:hypothetical protein AAFF_G00041220 [Aldrovandia affinis]|uniref:Uncharacterized protein n=1 Tax=Aldrovandia affinis TaxID=143900 RepID=A0AAD7WF58_9TELE|nr:hypothetical protein AAFF_G00041220 [Aldrovandia affinis]